MTYSRFDTRPPRMRRATCIATLLLLACAGGGSATAAEPSPRVMVVETPAMHIDRLYPSMAGPHERLTVDSAGLDWVTAYRTEVVDDESGNPASDEFFCHSQLQVPNESATRLMVTASGATEIRFPEGFGMPVKQLLRSLPEERRQVSFLGMVLNNHQLNIDRLVRIRATVEYYTDDDVGSPPRLRKLYKAGFPVTVQDLEAYTPAEGQENDDVTTHCVLVDEYKGHWIVPPGRQITRKTYDRIVPVESTVHYAIVHLHNYGSRLRFTDRTTGEMLWETEVRYEKDRKQIQEIPVYSSVDGFKVYPDHTYEVEALYENTSGHDVDAMATIDLYFHPLTDLDLFIGKR